MNIQEYLKKYKNNELYNDDDLIIAEVYEHIVNQIENYNIFNQKYFMNFSYMVACANYVLNLAEKNPQLLRQIHRLKLHQEALKDNGSIKN